MRVMVSDACAEISSLCEAFDAISCWSDIRNHECMIVAIDGRVRFHKVMNQVTEKQNYRKETHEFRLD